jgi:acyl-CoA synthetase (AMP-forming)/AMP-acid ligase II
MPWRQVAPGLVVPGSHRDAEGLLDLIENENVTAAFGVPTLWFGLLNALEGHPGRWKCHDSSESCAAVPESLLRGPDRFGIQVTRLWGMTETAPLATVGAIKSTLAGDPRTKHTNCAQNRGLHCHLSNCA